MPLGGMAGNTAALTWGDFVTVLPENQSRREKQKIGGLFFLGEPSSTAFRIGPRRPESPQKP